MTTLHSSSEHDATRAARRRLLEAMPKAELHLHLDGSLRIDTAIELARTRGIDAPRDWVGMSEALVGEMPGTPGRVAEAFRPADRADAGRRGVGTHRRRDGGGQGRRQRAVRRDPLGTAAPRHGRAPVGRRDRGGRPRARAARREDRHHGRLISTALRSHDPERNVELAETAARFIDRGLTGWDLAGQEAAYPDPLLHARSFEAARANGLRITIHAGEWGGAAQVRRSLVVDPERIAHGPAAIEDEELCAELRARGITLDLCPTSNWQAGIVPSVAEHPIGALYRMGVPVTLNTDDLTVSDLKLSEEYVNAAELIGLSLTDLWAIDRHALDVAFVDDATRDTLRAEFDVWAANVPELAAPGG